MLDAGIPYLNAAIQGTRGMMRYAKENPYKFIWKMGELGVASALLYEWNTQGVGGSQCYDSIPAAEKAKFFIFCLPMPPKIDNNGDERYPYVRLAKDQGQQIWTPLFDALAASFNKARKFDYDQIWEAFLGGLPVSDSSFAPPIETMRQAFLNHSTFFRDDIWKGGDVEKFEEYHSGTNPAAVIAGQATTYIDDDTGERKSLPGVGLSPVRTEAAVGALVAQSNPASQIFGLLMRKVLPKAPNQKEMSNEDFYNKYFFGLNRVVRFTRPGSPLSKKSIADALRAENTKKKQENDELKRIFDANKSDVDKRDEVVNEFIASVEESDDYSAMSRRAGTRLRNKYKFMSNMDKLGPIPDKGFWFKLKKLSNPETKAKAYYNNWKGLSLKMKKRYDEIWPKLQIISEDDVWIFEDMLDNLKNKDSKK